MKLLRLKITDPEGFRCLQPGFEHHFRAEWALQDELAKPDEFAPFVCAGPNGSGKSNLLEALAAIFFQLEVLRVRRSFLPEVLQNPSVDFTPEPQSPPTNADTQMLEYSIGVGPWPRPAQDASRDRR